jgi:hypothetical protein
VTNPESDRFDQIAFIGIRKKMAGAAYQRNRKLLIKVIWTHPLTRKTEA